MRNLNYKIIYSSKSKNDFSLIHNYLLSTGVSIENIIKVKNNIVAKINNLLAFPRLGPISKISNSQEYRILIINEFIVFYKIENENILIHRILHGKQDYESLLF